MLSRRRRIVYLIYLVVQPALILICIYGLGPVHFEHGSGLLEIFIGAWLSQFLLFFAILPVKKYIFIISSFLGFALTVATVAAAFSMSTVIDTSTVDDTTFEITYPHWVSWLSQSLPGNPSGDGILKAIFLVMLYILSVIITEIVYRIAQRKNVA